MPSPMGLPSPSPPSQSLFGKKKRSTTPLTDARSLLAYVSEGDRDRRQLQQQKQQMQQAPISSAASVMTMSSASTPALSTSSSITANSDDTLQEEYESDNDKFDDPENDESGLTRPKQAPNSTQVFTTRHVEFGHCANPAYRWVSKHAAGKEFQPQEEQDPPYHVLFFTYMSFIAMIVIGHMRDFFGKKFLPKFYRHLTPSDGYAALNSDFDSFYTRRLKLRMDDTFSRPVTGVPGRTIVLLDRHSDDYNNTCYEPGTRTRALNVSSYNYLGFAQARGGCADAVVEGIRRYGVSACGARLEGGTTDLHQQAEALVARFVGQEDALITSMGFATNSNTLPALVGKGCLVISDEYNHASIRVGVRLSGAIVRTFKHNDVADLENLLREVISQGQPRTHRPWKKILVVVEGLYSMEGTLVNLPAIVSLRRKYKFHLYVDEAHSIGAMGAHGRGVFDYFGLDPKGADVLMGTFTKSFGASGGYIAGSKALIARLRLRTHAGPYSEAMAPPVLTQVIASMSSIMGVHPTPSPSSTPTSPLAIEYPGPAPASSLPTWFDLPLSLRDGSEGRERLQRLAFNSRYLSRGLAKLGFITYGHSDSPIIPLMLFNPGKMALFSRMMLERKTPIVVVIVGYPATPLTMSRVRFCLSASHTKEDVDTLLRACDEVGSCLDLKLGKERWTVDEVISKALELVAMED